MVLHFHTKGLLEDGEFESLTPSLQSSCDYADAAWALVDIDLSKISLKQVRFNVSWPEYLLQRVDAYVEVRYETRSGFLASESILFCYMYKSLNDGWYVKYPNVSGITVSGY